ncbi:taste receptor type 2 member 9-like [Pleurodeles waltl]|uniref:taste receptor type 2 member 9-like n=1 Tax=Pleurodeles waltl TaxID=8319 RepID=UPI00370943F7
MAYYSGRSWAAKEVIVANLFLSNGLFSVCYNSVAILNEFFPTCQMGVVPCRLLVLAYIEPSVVSVWVTSMLSVFWWLKIHPVSFFTRLPMKAAWVAPAVMITTWVLWYVVLLPLLFFEARPALNVSISSQCLCLSPSTAGQFTYQYIAVTVGVIVPIVVLVLANACIIRAIIRHRNSIHGQRTLQGSRAHMHVQAAKNVLALTVCFVICWSLHFSTYATEITSYLLIVMLRSSTTNLYSIFSPLIICWGNRHFRDACWNLWVRLRGNEVTSLPDNP